MSGVAELSVARSVLMVAMSLFVKNSFLFGNAEEKARPID
jgi:hypothetical protein